MRKNSMILLSTAFSVYLLSPQVTALADELDANSTDAKQPVEQSVDMVDEEGEQATTDSSELGNENDEPSTDNPQNERENEETPVEQKQEDNSETKSSEQAEEKPTSPAQNVEELPTSETTNEEETDKEQEESEETEEPLEENSIAPMSLKVQSANALDDGVLEKGESHKDLIDYKKRLNKIGFGGISVTENFGSYTEKRVKQFQKNYGLAVDGKLGPATIAKLKEVSDSPFQVKKSHSEVSNLKVKLNRMGFSGITVTDNYGSYTAKKVKQFQRFANLKPNGIADATTREKLNQLYNNGFTTGDSANGISKFKQKLNKIGFGGITVTDNYGSYTAKKVKQFQEYYGLSNTGRANAATLNKIDDIYKNSYRQGMRNSALNQIKRDLNSLGFSGITVTSYFGSYTKKQVKNFQDYYGLKDTGVIEEKTLAKLNEVKSNPFRVGQSHKDLPKLKVSLNRLGFDGITVTENYGSYTEKQVRKFQDHYGLKVNGMLDEVTRNKINSLMSNGFRKGANHTGIKELKRDLNRIGFGKITVTSYYGNFSEKKVKEFQSYYGLSATGHVNDATFDMIEEIVKSPYQKGKSHSNLSVIKDKLNALGYGKITVTDNYGSFTEKKVKEFQRDHKLPVSGIIDNKTLNKINSAFDDLEPGEEVSKSQYNLSLNEAIAKQMGANPQTDKYRNDKAYISASYIDVYDGGSITGSSVNLRTSPNLGNNKNVETTVYYGAPFIILDDKVKGDTHAGSTTWYKIKYNNKELYVHSSLASKNSRIGITTANVNVREATNTTSHIYTTVKKGTTVTVLDEGSTWHQVSIGNWRNAKEQDVRYYLNPNNFVNDEKQRFQFLDLSYTDTVKASTLDKLLNGKGVLHGKGEVFIQAGKVNGVNPIYLVSHALLETAHGTSELATGVTVNGKRVYNIYGIGAYDNSAIEDGSKTAAAKGWTTVDKAIIGGAAFIGNGYIQAGQNTLYKMRWDPDQMVVGSPNHQYATDIGWASKQVTNIYNVYQQLDDYTLYFDIPVYK